MKTSKTVKERVSGAESVCVLTGAGISAESGVPTFRGKEGLWKKFKPEELANVDAFMQNPTLVWEWYSYRKKVISEVQPNPGHFALAEMQNLIRDFTLVTQNVDNLHTRAGSRDVLELRQYHSKLLYTLPKTRLGGIASKIGEGRPRVRLLRGISPTGCCVVWGIPARGRIRGSGGCSGSV